MTVSFAPSFCCPSMNTLSVLGHPSFRELTPSEISDRVLDTARLLKSQIKELEVLCEESKARRTENRMRVAALDKMLTAMAVQEAREKETSRKLAKTLAKLLGIDAASRPQVAALMRAYGTKDNILDSPWEQGDQHRRVLPGVATPMCEEDDNDADADAGRSYSLCALSTSSMAFADNSLRDDVEALKALADPADTSTFGYALDGNNDDQPLSLTKPLFRSVADRTLHQIKSERATGERAWTASRSMSENNVQARAIAARAPSSLGRSSLFGNTAYDKPSDRNAFGADKDSNKSGATPRRKRNSAHLDPESSEQPLPRALDQTSLPAPIECSKKAKYVPTARGDSSVLLACVQQAHMSSSSPVGPAGFALHGDRLARSDNTWSLSSRRLSKTDSTNSWQNQKAYNVL